MSAAEMINETLRHGVAADVPLEPPRHGYRQSRISRLAKEAGIKVETKTMWVEGERLFVVWRTG